MFHTEGGGGGGTPQRLNLPPHESHNKKFIIMILTQIYNLQGEGEVASTLFF